METRGPPEGAPLDPMDISIMDKLGSEIDSGWPGDNIISSSTLCDQPKKHNNRLFFLTVEYVEDQAGCDYPRFLPTYEAISFSPRPNSPLSDFEHQVSPHDPNMSSAARYSPTPVPLPSPSYPNSVVVLQGPPSPLISISDTTARVSNGFTSQLADQTNSQNISPEENHTDFADSPSEGLVSSVGNELILMQGANNELENSTTPLLLAGLQGSDLTLARDFLAMQDDQLNVMSSIKINSNLETNSNDIVESILPDVGIQDDSNDQKKTATINNLENENKEKMDMQSSKQMNVETNNKNFYINDFTVNDDCDSNEGLHSVCAIADQPVPSRAIATLPEHYLSIAKLSLDGETEFGVFAKQNIRCRTQFGPIEGIFRLYDGTPISNGLPLLYENDDGELLQIDVSDENASNWMRFVRPALTNEEQNLAICQQNDGLVFLSTKNILPNEELKAGPSLEYGMRRNLPILEPLIKDASDSGIDQCTSLKSEGSGFGTVVGKSVQSNKVKTLKKRKKINSVKLLNTLDSKKIFGKDVDVKVLGKNMQNSNETVTKNDLKVKIEGDLHYVSQPQQPQAKVRNAPPVLYKCSTCSKRFVVKARLIQHCQAHANENEDSLICNVCSKTFTNGSGLSRHLKTHEREKQTPVCPVCKESFGRVLSSKDSVDTEIDPNETFTCPHCPKTFVGFSLIRRHARTHHCEYKHECQFCEKRFPAADKLRMHMLRHSDHREFQCANCGKQFKRKDKLKEHVTRVHHSQRSEKDQMSMNGRTKKSTSKVNPMDCDRFVYKCRRCQVGFKRRGMLVNHLAKRHPDVPPESVPELCLPILRQTRDYYCQYCEKVYKSSSKRKAHIVKNHPGAALPPSNRTKEHDIPGLPNPTYSQAAGSIKTVPQGCQWCHKQYASKAKLLQHQRKKHSSLMEPADQVPRPRSRPPQNQNQPPAPSPLASNNTTLRNLIIAGDCGEVCSPPRANSDFSKNRLVRIANGNNDLNLSIGNGGLEYLDQQFVRVRDMR